MGSVDFQTKLDDNDVKRNKMPFDCIFADIQYLFYHLQYNTILSTQPSKIRIDFNVFPEKM